MPENIVDQRTAHPSKRSRVPLLELQVLLFKCWLALRAGMCLCWLPIFLRVHTLPALLQRFTPVQGQQRNPTEVKRAVRLVVRLCQLRLFRWPMFPRMCLRQALALYRVLTWMGYPVEIHFGIHKEGEDLRGHSWVTVQGQPVAERAQTEVFRTIYSYSSATSCSSVDKVG